jgi:hypothetical protein
MVQKIRILGGRVIGTVLRFDQSIGIHCTGNNGGFHIQNTDIIALAFLSISGGIYECPNSSIWCNRITVYIESFILNGDEVRNKFKLYLLIYHMKKII